MFKKIISFYKRAFWTPEKYACSLGVKIGLNCSIATRYFGSEPYLIEIGDHVQITEDVKFFTHGGGWIFRDKYPNFDTFGKIKIGNNVYIGNSSLIMPGVIIGNNVIIGAGSIVTKSIPDNVVVAGNPIKFIATIEDLEERLLKHNINSKKMNFNEKKQFLIKLNDDLFLKKSELIIR